MQFDIFKFELFLKGLKDILPYFFVGLLIIETAYLLLVIKKYNKKETFVNIATGVVAILAQFGLKLFFFTNIYPSVYQHRLFDLPLGWYQFFSVLLIYAFMQWLIHFIEHKVRFFWCLHEVHHSATHMNVTTGLRNSIFDLISLEMLYLLIPFFGFHYIFYFLFYTLNKFWASFIHVNEKLIGQIPVLKYFLVTPAGHHIHHARNIPYLDKNYGELIPWFDFLFKTYATERTEKIQYGTVKITKEIGFWEAQVHEFRQLGKDIKATPKLIDKLLYLIMSPGWHPGNFSQTTKQLQKSYKENGS